MKFLIPVHKEERVSYSTAYDMSFFLKKLGHDCTVLPIEGMINPDDFKKSTSIISYDTVLSINYLKHFFGDLFDGVPFITWLQDGMSIVNQASTAKYWNENCSNSDWLIGYTDQLVKYGYDQSRLIEMPMLISPEKYYFGNNDRRIPDDSVSFVGNRGDVPSAFVAGIANKMVKIMSQVTGKSSGFPLGQFLERVDCLEKLYYHDDFKITSPVSFGKFMCQNSAVNSYYDSVPAEMFWMFAENFMFWGLNEIIYRQTVINWIIDNGRKISIYGAGWGDRERYRKYSKGYLDPILARHVHHNAKYSLHLNSIEGTHQRPFEILMSGGNLLTRSSTGRKEIKKFSKRKYFKGQKEVLSNILTAISGNDKKLLPENHVEQCRSLQRFRDYSTNFNSKKELLDILKG